MKERKPTPTEPDVTPAANSKDVDKQILGLALPALGALIVEPLMVLADSAMVGHLGTNPLAGLALGSTIMLTIVGLFIFLAYTTTAVASRQLGAGDEAGAIRSGVEGIWFAGFLGLLMAPLMWLLAPTVVGWFSPEPAVFIHAVAYVRWGSPGLLGMFLVLGGTGALRGLLDNRSPMYVSVGGAILNVIFNATLIYGFDMGVAGSAAGTSLAQTLMAVALTVLISRGARRHGVSLRPTFHGARAVGAAGAPLMARTAALRAAFLLTTWAATSAGAVPLAGHQITIALWGLGSYGMDALAIASQALIGHGLGTGSSERIRQVLRRCLTWGWWIGSAVGVIFLVLSPVLPWLFTQDQPVFWPTTVALIICGLSQPMTGYVFILDGVLIGANRTKYLAVAAVINLAVYLPFVLLIGWYSAAWGNVWALGALWFAFSFIYTGMRAVTNRYGAKDLLR
ncbi:MATE family efflux transporter [Boudabousia marimammalium]|uniref:MATE family efflux transporter n=1 Tax=Boudabousia marimammalium TaxID=156892 RepID=A0A1Q5PSU0_9ACTO|nr:MATE family efflux transporter [Boudabousia marimammalium]OKL50515.1 hypothetical protein BM477_00650 [Boudabousia marimammalium]